MKKAIKRAIKQIFHFLPFNNRFRLRGTVLRVGKKVVSKCIFDCAGENNTICFEDEGTISRSRFFIRGNNNTIIVGSGSSACGGEFWIEDDNNAIIIGKHTNLTGKCQLACIEGCRIEIGDECLLSSDIVIRTGDSHTITDLDGTRINPSCDVHIGRHVWLGHRVVVNKGVSIADNSVVGANAVVTRSEEREHIILAGCPARVVRQDIDWDRERK